MVVVRGKQNVTESTRASLVLMNKTRGQCNCGDCDHSQGDTCRSWQTGVQASSWAAKK